MPRRNTEAKKVLIFSLVSLMLILAFSTIYQMQAPTGFLTWWNNTWIHKQSINITEVAGVARFNDVVDAYTTFPRGTISNCTKELRVIKPNNFTRAFRGALITEDFNDITNTTKWLNTTVSGLSSFAWANRELKYSISDGSSVAADSIFRSSNIFNVDADIVAEFLSIGNSGFPSNGAVKFGINLTNSTLAKSEFFSVDSVYNNLNAFHLNHSNTTRSTSIITNTVPWDYTTLAVRYYQSRNNADFLLNGNSRKTVNLTDEGFADSIKNYNVSIFASGVDHGGSGYDLRIDNIRAYPVPIFNPVKFNITDNGTAINNVNVSVYFPNGTLVFSNNTSSDGIVALNLTNMSVFPVAAGIVLRNSTGSIVGSETIDYSGIEGLYPNDTWNFDINQPVEIFLQVYNETYAQESCTSANLVFEANVSANANVTYNVFYHNGAAAQPSYGSNIFNSTTSPNNNFYYGNFTKPGSSYNLYLNDSSQRDTYGLVQMGSQMSFSNLTLLSNGPIQATIKLFENSSYGTYQTNATIKKNRMVDYNSWFNFTGNSGLGAGIDNNVLFYIMSSYPDSFNNTLSRGNISAKANNEVNYGGLSDTRGAFFTNPDPTWFGMRTYGKYISSFNIKPSFNTLLYEHDSGDPDRISISETSGTLSGTQRYFNFTIVARDLQTGDFPYWENVTENPLNISFGAQENGPNFIGPTTTTTTAPVGGPSTPPAKSVTSSTILKSTTTTTNACNCAPAEKWSACFEGKQTRKNYNCGSDTFFSCKEYLEESPCEIPCNSNETSGSSELSIPYAPSEKNVVCNITGTSLPAQQIEFSPNATLQNAKIILTQLNNTAAADDLPSADGNIFSLINITKQNFTSKSLSSIIIRFFVDKAWINNNTYSPESVKLRVLKNSSWEDVPTKKTSEDRNKANYEAVLKEVGLYSIVGPTSSPWSTCINRVQERVNYKCSAIGCTFERETKSCEQCPVACVAASQYSTCIAGKQARKNYICNSDTNFVCMGVEQSRACFCSGDVEKSFVEAEASLRRAKLDCESIGPIEIILEQARSAETCETKKDFSDKAAELAGRCEKREVVGLPLLSIAVAMILIFALALLLFRRLRENISAHPQ